MKKILKTTLLASTFVSLVFVGATQVNANSYGSDVVTSTTPEIHKTVDAGIVDMLPQLILSATAVSGVLTTSFLLRKTK